MLYILSFKCDNSSLLFYKSNVIIFILQYFPNNSFMMKILRFSLHDNKIVVIIWHKTNQIIVGLFKINLNETKHEIL